MKNISTGMMAAALLLGLYGCGAPSESESTPPAASNVTDSHEGHDDHEHADHAHDSGNPMTDMEKMKVELAKLSPEDAASAEKQHICPVTDEMLGTMGPPIKVDVNGTQVWICCEGCRKQLLKSPAEYLAKLNIGGDGEN